MANKFDVGLIVLTLLISGTVVLQLTDQVRLRVDADKTSIYVPHAEYHWIWVVGGREYNRLFDGASIMLRDRAGISIETFVDNDTKNITIVRTTPYQRGPVIRDTYQFNGSLKDVASFPVSHKIEVFNASGKFYRYTVDELSDVPDRTKLSGELQLSFGRNIKVTLQENYRWAWLGWPYGSDSLSAQYNLPSDYEVFNVRLFDPPTTATVLTLDGTSADKTYELGTPVQLVANVTDSGTPIAVNVFLSIDAPGYGTNYTNGTSPFSYNWTSIAGIIKMNDSNTAKNYSFNDNSTVDYFYRLHEDDEFINGSIDLRGFALNSDYAHDFSIDIGNDGTKDIVLYGDLGALSSSILNESSFNGSVSTVENSWEPDEVATTRVAYIRAPLLNASTATLNLTSNPTANATTAHLASWAAGYDYGGLNFSDVYECWQPVGGIIGDKYYQIGGKCLYGDGCEYNCSIYYDIDANSFTQTTDLPYSMSSGCAVSYDNDDDGVSEDIFIFGGQDSSSVDIATVYKLNSSGYYAMTSMPDARTAPSCVLVGNTVYLFGEVDLNATVLKYNITADSWSTGTLNENKSGYSHAAQMNSTHILVWGGANSGWGDTEFYSMTSDTGADTGTDFRVSGGIGLSFKTGTDAYDIYSVGGYCLYGNDCGENNHYVNETWKYNSTSGEFEEASEVYSWSTGATNKGLFACGWGIHNGTLYASPTSISGTYSQELMRFYFLPKGLTFLVGSETTPAWNYSGSLLTYEYRGSDGGGGDEVVEESGDFTTQFNEYIADCTISPYCDVPVYINSGTAGTIILQDLNVTYTIDDVSLNMSAFNGTGWYDETVNLSAVNEGTVEISDIKIHKDGHENITITANYYGNATYDASNDSQVALLYYSDWDYTMPYDFLEFIPKNPTAQNVTPYGQTTSDPILNVTIDTVNCKNMSWSMMVNESYADGNKNGTLSGDTSWVSGYSNTALDFDGTNDYVTMDGSIANWTYGDNFSILMWVNPDEGVTSSKIMAMHYASTRGWMLRRYQGYLRLNLYNGTHETHQTTWGSLLIPQGSWSLVGFTFNGTHVTGRVNESSDTEVVDNYTYTNTGNFLICYTSEDYDGQIDEVKIFDRALSADEVHNVYDGVDVRTDITAYYPFDWGTGTTAYDLSEGCLIKTTVSNSSTKSDGIEMTGGTWETFQTNNSNGSNFGVWMWLDYLCYTSGWRVWQPAYNFRGCCIDCVCSEEV